MERKTIPSLNKIFDMQPWLQTFIKVTEESKAEEVLKEYYGIIKDTIKEDYNCFDGILDVLERRWFLYLYPDICLKYSDAIDSSEKETMNPDNIGHHPYCPPILHVNFINILENELWIYIYAIDR